MNEYEIKLFDKKGKELPESFTVEYDGTVGARFKEHYRKYARMFLNPRTETIQVKQSHHDL